VQTILQRSTDTGEGLLKLCQDFAKRIVVREYPQGPNGKVSVFRYPHDFAEFEEHEDDTVLNVATREILFTMAMDCFLATVFALSLDHYPDFRQLLTSLCSSGMAFSYELWCIRGRPYVTWGFHCTNATSWHGCHAY
jgi:hypothetical protein